MKCERNLTMETKRKRPPKRCKHSDNVAGMAITKTNDDYELIVKFLDGSSLVFDCKFTTVGKGSFTAGLGDVSGVGKYN
jgi:hypothetical protein